MYLDASLDPYRETGFVSGSEVYGQVSTFAEMENLTQGQWALLLTRKKVRPEGETKPIVSRKETLRIQMGKDDAILDTIMVMIDYGMPPEIKNPMGLTGPIWKRIPPGPMIRDGMSGIAMLSWLPSEPGKDSDRITFPYP